MPPRLTIEKERRLTSFFFFIYGFGSMSWIPRFPDVKANLGISNGQFGSMISLIALGAIVSFITVGHLVHRIGAFKSLTMMATLLFSTYIAIVFCSSTTIFPFLMIFLGIIQSAFHIAANAQAFDTQARAGQLALAGWHGMWSSGAMAAALVGIFAVGRVSAEVHVTTAALLSFAITLILVFRQRATLVKPGEGRDAIVNIREIFTEFHFDWVLSIAFVSACILEHASADWSTIYAKEELGIKSGLSVLPFLLFTTMMIFGRLYSSQLLKKYSPAFLIPRGALFGSLGFALFFFSAAALPESQKHLALALTCLAFMCGGLGSSFIGPIFFNLANTRSPHPSAVFTGHFGAQNQILFFITKMTIAWTAEFTGSIAIALAIPAFLLFTVASYTQLIKSASTK